MQADCAAFLLLGLFLAPRMIWCKIIHGFLQYVCPDTLSKESAVHPPAPGPKLRQSRLVQRTCSRPREMLCIDDGLHSLAEGDNISGSTFGSATLSCRQLLGPLTLQLVSCPRVGRDVTNV